MLRVNVAGGTGAGTRIVRAPYPQPWTCTCGYLNPKHATRCLASGCGEKRP